MPLVSQILAGTGPPMSFISCKTYILMTSGSTLCQMKSGSKLRPWLIVAVSFLLYPPRWKNTELPDPSRAVRNGVVNTTSPILLYPILIMIWSLTSVLQDIALCLVIFLDGTHHPPGMWSFVSIAVLVLQFGIISRWKGSEFCIKSQMVLGCPRAPGGNQICMSDGKVFCVRMIWRKSSAKGSISGQAEKRSKWNFHGNKRRTKTLYKCIYSIFQTTTSYTLGSEIKMHLVLPLSKCSMYSALPLVWLSRWHTSFFEKPID